MLQFREPRLLPYKDNCKTKIVKAGWWNEIVHKPNGWLHHAYLVPGAGYYQLFDWDTYFMGVALSYLHRGKGLAGSVEDFLHFTDHNWAYRGYTPREITGRHLWAHVATTQQARIMIKRYVLNPREFWTPFGIRSLAPSSVFYHQVHGYWQGPIWIISNYMVMHGLMNYGYDSQARTLAVETARTLLRDINATGGMRCSIA